MSMFLYDNYNADDDDETKAIAIPRVFSENSRAKNKILLIQNQFLGQNISISDSEGPR